VIVIALIIALFGIAERIALLFLAGNRQIGPLSGVGDQVRYLTLADSIFQGRGFSYAGQPTALRPPLYPLLLAGSHIAFGSHYLLAMRVFQFLVGIAVAYVCLLLAENLFGVEAGAMAGAVALALPTLVVISSELQTEQLASFLTVLFLFFLVGEIQGKDNGAVGMGITSGLAALIRFNCAILPIVGAIICLMSRRSLKNALLVCFVAGLFVAPWIVRNVQVFHGKVLFSSHGGINLLEGALTPDGRAQNGEDERVRAAVGWLHTDIEMNNSHRLLFASEDQLDRQARAAGIDAWKNLSWHSRLKLLITKIVTFLLSKDQLLDTNSFSPMQRKLREAGVMAYWFALVLALLGWMSLFSSSRIAALMIAFYVVVVTSAHLPFVMNTRLRIPFIDPLLTVLAGGGFYFLICKYQHRRVFSACLQQRPNQSNKASFSAV
jgi:4-amino-4-deoxy-L-arabinose transferase-like glycosyltransferase